MSCGPKAGSFRLLDGVVGWDAECADGLVGLDDPGGIRLDEARSRPCVVHRATVGRCVVPAALAVDRDGTWYLAGGTRVLRLAPCDHVFRPIAAASFEAIDIRAVAWSGDLLATVDAGRDVIRLLHGGVRTVQEVDVARLGLRPDAVAITRFGELILAAGREVVALGLDGTIRDRVCLPTSDPVVAIAPVCLCSPGSVPATSLVVVTDAGGEWCGVWAVDLIDHSVRAVHGAELECCRGHTELTTATEGFCLARSSSGVETTSCFDWSGAPLDALPAVAARPPLVPEGRLLTTPLDSGVDGCRWHRVRVDVSEPLPPGALVVEVVSLTSRDEVPAEHDWDVLADATDGLIRQPPGRYLRVRLTLRPTGTTSPVARGIRLDFERSTSFEHLPAVYGEDLDAADFGARFLALFDASIGAIDESLDRAIGRLDPLSPLVTDELLPALARWLGIEADAAWPPDRLRRLLTRANHLAERAGTTTGLVDLVETLFGVVVVVEELGRCRPWAALGGRAAHQDDGSVARLGEVRISTRSRAAVRLGSSVLGRTAVDGAADPDQLPYITGANRVRVHVPAGLSVAERARLRPCIVANLPATVAADVRFGRPGFVVSAGVVVGIDTAVRPLEPAVLGGDEDHRPVVGGPTVLAAGAGGGATVTVGRRASVGITTTVW
jgi:phage tail-like protein